MKKIFSKIGLFGLVIFSFFYTHKTVTVLKENDDIMIKIKENINNYNIYSINSVINGDTIIPGIKGNIVNIDKSYENMKKIGIYNSNYLIYDIDYPKTSLKDNKDKYIVSGNSKKKEVSLLFIINNDKIMDSLLKILDNENIKADFFITGDFINKNEAISKYLIKNGHSINYYGDYSKSDFIFNNTIIRNSFKQKNIYCYLEDKNKKYLDTCYLNKNYTIIPNIIIKNNMLNSIKKELRNGGIISIYIGNIDELSITIKYIKSRGYDIVKLDKNFDM